MRVGTLMAKVMYHAVAGEIKRGTLLETIRKSRKEGTFTNATPFFMGDFMEDRAKRNADRSMLFFRDRQFTYRQMDENSNRVANGLLSMGAKSGDGIALFTVNSPRFYDLYFGTMKTGLYGVPVNTALRGDQLAHILGHSEVKHLAVHHGLYPYFEQVRDKLPKIENVIIDAIDAPEDYNLPDGAVNLDDFYGDNVSTSRPKERPDEGDLQLLMYTSGTTGLPKGVVYRYGDRRMIMLEALTKSINKKDDIFYTCLPLFHANALFVTTMFAMGCEAAIALSTKFSARGFWDDVRELGGTTFNLLGAMIPILMKQPPRPNDRDHKVRRVITSACPADLWEKFEKRFGVEIWEAYGAVDGGGSIIMNIGNAPKGSIGKPMGVKVKVADENGRELGPNERGELLIFGGKKKKKEDDEAVTYFKDDKATSKKIKDGWIHTGDYVYRDEKGFIYFVGRDSESMRRRGENVSTYEVEHQILKHSSVQECAVYGVPAELGEDDIMTSVVLVEGKELDPKELIEFLSDKLAYFAIPRYVRVVDELPKTETHRVIKRKLQDLGVTEDAWDAEKAGVKLKKP